MGYKKGWWIQMTSIFLGWVENYQCLRSRLHGSLGNHRAMDALVENHWSLNWTISKLAMLWLSYQCYKWYKLSIYIYIWYANISLITMLFIWLVIKCYQSHCIPYAVCNGKLIKLNGGIFAPHVRPCGFSFCRRKMGAFDERIEMSLIKNPKILMFI